MSLKNKIKEQPIQFLNLIIFIIKKILAFKKKD